MSWAVGTTDGLWQVGTTSIPPPTFAVLTAGPYRHGQSCTLDVIGANSTFWIIWSPVNDPLDALAIQLLVTGTNLDVDGTGTVTVTADRGAVRYGQSGYMFLRQAEFSSALLVPLLVDSGKQYVTLVDPLVLPAEGISAVPDLAAEDQVVWWGVSPSGTVTVYDNRSFTATADVESFLVEAHIMGFGYTDPATQYINTAPAVSLTGVITDTIEYVTAAATAPSFVSQWTTAPRPVVTWDGLVLANHTNIHYAVLPGHNPHAPTALKFGTDGATDNNGFFSITDINYPAGQPVTVVMRWVESNMDRYVVLYTELVAQV